MDVGITRSFEILSHDRDCTEMFRSVNTEDQSEEAGTGEIGKYDDNDIDEELDKIYMNRNFIMKRFLLKLMNLLIN